jgi:hypothetical protein
MVDSKEKKIENGIVPYTTRGNEITFQSKADFIRAFDEFKSQRVAELLLSSGIQGNRAGLNARVEIMLEFLHNGKSKSDFVRICALRGYSQEKREELWNDFEQVWIPEFKRTLLEAKKEEDNGEFKI